MSEKQSAQTDPKARLKMLAAIAIAEATDGRGNPDAVKPYLKQVFTGDLWKICAATNYCVIQQHIVTELAQRSDIELKDFLDLILETEHDSVKKMICNAAKEMPQIKNIPIEDIVKLYESGALQSGGGMLQAVLQRVPKGELPELFKQVGEVPQFIAEFKRRNDPIGENLLSIVAMDIPDTIRRTFIHLAQTDSRITAEHILETPGMPDGNIDIYHLFYEKLRNTSIAKRMAWYKTENESFRLAIIASLDVDPSKALQHIDYFFYEHARTDAVRADVIQTLGPHLPLEKLLELRSETGSKTVTDAFDDLFGEHTRYIELQKFLSS